jgi:hypothetical protein
MATDWRWAERLTLEEHTESYFYCEYHPREVVSNGVFDAPCAACEGEALEAMYEEMAREEEAEQEARDTEVMLARRE